ncbi:MAG: hypothetical protein IT378_15030 [Sandaracinaceae bacterium]|nr:hypothetical protein [Sandaracinaceae bacterium]
MARTSAEPLDDAWLALIDRLAPRLLGPHDRRGQALADEVARLSELYNERQDLLRQVTAPAARMRFFLPRDLPKIEGPLAELAFAGALPKGPRWRVIDAGAGLGTTSLGVARFAKRAGIEGVDVLALERDPAALDTMRTLCREASAQGLCAPIALREDRLDLEADLAAAGLPEADLVLMGLSLNELFFDRERDERLERKRALLGALGSRLSEGGALVVIEPAYRGVARELMRLRDRIAPLHVFAPCIRNDNCPLLLRERDWCHDQLPFDLPAALARLAEAAGLRAHRLTYAYLTLRRVPGAIVGVDPRVARVVGGPVVEKARTEWMLCGAHAARVMQLDRERSDANAPMQGAARGSLVRFDREIEEQGRLRLRPDVRVERLFR